MALFGRKAKKELEELRNKLSPEQTGYIEIKDALEAAKADLEKVGKELELKNQQLEEKSKLLISTDEELLLQSFGIYTPRYAYETSDEYKEKIKAIRENQKDLIKAGKAVNKNMNWTVSGSVQKGKKMVNDMSKLLLRAFNTECDDAIEHVKFNNIESCEKKIKASADAISKLGNMMEISITGSYINLKLEELHLMHEYRQIKQAEKEAAKELRQQQREEAKAAKELEAERKKLEKEQTHYENALAKITEQIANADDSQKADLIAKKEELEAQLSTIDKEMKDVDYRAANQRAGYVYVISNIGAFGENVYKIGMTRRLDPMERVDELGDASVPFNFDVHAMIFSDDAPGLETALHNAFADKKLNFINQRREFFRVTLDEIKAVIRANYDKTVEFVDVAPAQQYRESLILRQSKENA